MKSNFFSLSTILKKFLLFNFIIFLFLGIFTFLYLQAIRPNLVNNRSDQHSRIIENTSNHIDRLNMKFTEESATDFFLSTRFLFQNLDRVQLYDLDLNLLADTDTLDLAQDIFIKKENVQETEIDGIEVMALTSPWYPNIIEMQEVFELDGIRFEQPSTHLFTFNNPVGACKTCEGYGSIMGIDQDLVIPNTGLSIYEDAIACWRGDKLSKYKEDIIFNAEKSDYKKQTHTVYGDSSIEFMVLQALHQSCNFFHRCFEI